VPASRRKSIGPWALEELQKAYKAGNRSPALYQDIGAVYDTLDRVDLAIDAYTRALVPAPGDVKTLVMRGKAYALKKQFDRAEADFRNAIRLDPEHADAHAGLGFVRATLKAPDDAQREALQAVLLTD